MPEDTSVVPSLRPAGSGLEHLDRITYYEQQNAMILDQVTARNLELVESVSGDDASATLLQAMDETATAMGARLLRAWILRPEICLQEIELRLEAIANLKARTMAREEIRQELEAILDLERLTSRIFDIPWNRGHATRSSHAAKSRRQDAAIAPTARPG